MILCEGQACSGVCMSTRSLGEIGKPAAAVLTRIEHAGLCSVDGRHLALMPHPERTVFKWQWGYMSQQMENDLDASPWLQMFQNARQWCDKPVERH